jgi:transposase
LTRFSLAQAYKQAGIVYKKTK